jgi:hypothetical protein
MSKRLERERAKWIRSAISIQASGHVNGCTNRPDTRKHLSLRAQTLEKPLASEGASTHGHWARGTNRPRRKLFSRRIIHDV